MGILQKIWTKLRHPGEHPAQPLSDRTLKLQIFGDSISDTTWGDRRTWVSFFPRQLADAGLELVNNAIGGGNLAAVPGKKNCVVKLACNGRMLHPDSDLVILFAGSNDWACDLVPLGSPETEDPATVYGAVKALIRYIRSHCTGKLLFITPLQRFNYRDRACTQQDGCGNRLNEQGYSLRQLADAIIEVCQSENVACLDLYHHSGITEENITQYTIDGLHPNISGDQRIAACIYSKLNQLGL